jgi:hypothetical protein
MKFTTVLSFGLLVACSSPTSNVDPLSSRLGQAEPRELNCLRRADALIHSPLYPYLPDRSSGSDLLVRVADEEEENSPDTRLNDSLSPMCLDGNKLHIDGPLYTPSAQDLGLLCKQTRVRLRC